MPGFSTKSLRHDGTCQPNNVNPLINGAIQMARNKFEELSIVSEFQDFTIRQHVSTKAGESITTPSGKVIEYPIARISRDNSESVDVAELIEALDNAFKSHWDNCLEAPDHVEFPSLAYRISIGLNHAHSLEHDGRWPSGVPSYRFESFKKDLIEAIADADDTTTDPRIADLKSDYPDYFQRWKDETAAAQAAMAAL